MAVLFPIALTLLLTIVQAGLLWHAHNVLSEAAQAGVSAGRVLHGSGADAERAALSFLHRAGASVVTEPDASATRDADTVTVTTVGTAHKLLPVPGLEWRMSVGASAPVEAFTTPGNAP